MQIYFVKFRKISSNNFVTVYFIIKIAVLQLELLLEKGSIADVSHKFRNTFQNGPSKIRGIHKSLLGHS